MSTPNYIGAWALLQSEKDIGDQIFLYGDNTVFYWKEDEVNKRGKTTSRSYPKSKITTTPPATSKRGKRLFSITRNKEGPVVNLTLHQKIPIAVDDQKPFGKMFFVSYEHIITIDNRLEYFLFRLDDDCPDEPIVSNYKILSCIGDGAFSFVYKCINVYDGTIKALKWMKQEPECNDVLMEMFRNENRVLSRLSHSNIVRMEDFVCSGRSLTFFVMDYYPGNDLLERITRPTIANLLTQTKIKRIFYQIITALVYLHSSQVIHRDVKPSNIFLVDRHGGGLVAKLGDFGIALDEKESNGVALAAGSKYYAPPETLPHLGTDVKLKHTYAVDIWSFAVSLYFALAKCFPFGELDDFVKYSENVSDLNPDFDRPELAGVCLQAKALMMHTLRSTAEDRVTAEEVIRSEWFINVS